MEKTKILELKKVADKIDELAKTLENSTNPQVINFNIIEVEDLTKKELINTEIGSIVQLIKTHDVTRRELIRELKNEKIYLEEQIKKELRVDALRKCLLAIVNNEELMKEIIGYISDVVEQDVVEILQE